MKYTQLGFFDAENKYERLELSRNVQSENTQNL